MARGTGLTTRQMLDAPHGALYVVPDGAGEGMLALAGFAERDDLRIVGASVLGLRDAWMGSDYPAVVIDHSARLTEHEWGTVEMIRTRRRVHG